MIWTLSHRADDGARRIADRHYNRQHPGSRQFVPPGYCLVLKAPSAIWVTSWPLTQFVRHQWAGAWMNSCFRREGGGVVASDMIRQAIAATLGVWPDPPPLGMVTFIDASKVRVKKDPGYCYLRAGFRYVGTTQKGLLAMQMLPSDMPPADVPHGNLEGLLKVARAGQERRRR